MCACVIWMITKELKQRHTKRIKYFSFGRVFLWEDFVASKGLIIDMTFASRRVNDYNRQFWRWRTTTQGKREKLSIARPMSVRSRSLQFRVAQDTEKIREEIKWKKNGRRFCDSYGTFHGVSKAILSNFASIHVENIISKIIKRIIMRAREEIHVIQRMAAKSVTIF